MMRALPLRSLLHHQPWAKHGLLADFWFFIPFKKLKVRVHRVLAYPMRRLLYICLPSNAVCFLYHESLPGSVSKSIAFIRMKSRFIIPIYQGRYSYDPFNSIIFHSPLFHICSGIFLFVCLIPAGQTPEYSVLLTSICAASAALGTDAFSKYFHNFYRLLAAFLFQPLSNISSLP